MNFKIETIDEFAKDFAVKPKRSGDYYLLMIHKGKGSVKVDFFTHQLKENIIWFITCGRAVQTEITDGEGTVVRFNDSFFDLNRIENRKSFRGILHHYFCHSPFFQPNLEELSQFQHLFKEIEKEYYLQNSSTVVLQSYLKITLVTYQRAIKPNSEDKNGTIIDPIIALRSDIEQNYIQEKNAAFYAGKQNLSLKRLNEISTSSIGKTVTKLIHERLLLEAKRRLLFTSLSVSEIAYQIGFEDANYFYHFIFK